MSINPLKFPDDSTRENISSSKQIEIVDSGTNASQIMLLRVENEQLKREKNEIEAKFRDQIKTLETKLRDVQQKYEESEKKTKKIEEALFLEKSDNIKLKEGILIEKENEKRKVKKDLKVIKEEKIKQKKENEHIKLEILKEHQEKQNIMKKINDFQIKIFAIEQKNKKLKKKLKRNKDEKNNALKMQSTKLKNEIKKIKHEYPQVIPHEYNVIGGLPGVGQDIMLEILSQMRNIQNAVQFVFINKKTLKLKSHYRFLKIIDMLNVQFKMKNPDPDTVILKYVDGIHRKVVLNKTVERAIGINPVQEQQKLLILFQNNATHTVCHYMKSKTITINYFVLQYLDKFSLNDNMNIICFDAYAGQIWYKGQETSGNSKYKDGQKIGLQLDMEKGTLHFFIDDIQQPVFVRGINEPGHIYDGGASFTIVSFRKLYDAAIYTLPNEKVIDW